MTPIARARKRSDLPPQKGPELVGGAPAVEELGGPLEDAVATRRHGVPLELTLETEAVLDDGLDPAHVGQSLDAVGASDPGLLGTPDRQAAHSVADEAGVDA